MIFATTKKEGRGDSPGLLSFDEGLGGDADRPKGGGVDVLGLESGVRGILGLDVNAFS